MLLIKIMHSKGSLRYSLHFILLVPKLINTHTKIEIIHVSVPILII
jgi:hypothetical protein